MMRRVLWFMAKLAVVIAAALWVVQRPGRIQLEWLGWHVEAPIGILIVAVVLLLAAVILLYRLYLGLRRVPQDYARHRADRQMQKGYRALTRGLVSLAAGDVAEAKRDVRAAHKLLDNPALTLLLAAQTAQLAGDEALVRRYYGVLAERSDAALIGLRGLLLQALRLGDDQAAKIYAERAWAQRPTGWAATILADLRARGGDWAGAEAALSEAERLKALPKDEARDKRAALAAERARVQLGTDNLAAAEAAAKEALKLRNDYLPAQVLLSHIYSKAGSRRALTKLVEHVWPQQPHPDFAAAYVRVGGDSADVRLKQALHLAATAPDLPESLTLVARAALIAGDLSRADAALQRYEALRLPVTVSLCRLGIDLAQRQGNEERTQLWRAKMMQAGGDPGWRCGACGNLHDSWQALCGQCGQFDKITWISGAVPGGLLEPPAPPKLRVPMDGDVSEAAIPHDRPRPSAASESPLTKSPAQPAAAPPEVDAARAVN